MIQNRKEDRQDSRYNQLRANKYNKPNYKNDWYDVIYVSVITQKYKLNIIIKTIGMT